MGKIEKYIEFMPKALKPSVNPNLNALIKAFAGQDDALMEQLRNTKAQLFVKTAEGTYLDKVASNYGVSRPAELGLLDEDFQKLIPNLSLKGKQVTRAFYDTMDVFWGETYSRASVTSVDTAPYNISPGDTISVSVDGKPAQNITVLAGEIKIPGQASSKELERILAKIEGATPSIVQDLATNSEKMNLRTNTTGLRGSIEVISGFGSLGFAAGEIRVSHLPQRTVLYQINPGELVIELPAVVPTLRRTLKGSHHFHTDSTIEPAVPPSDGIWQGSFIYATNSSPYTVTKTKAVLETLILKGSVLNQITVSSTAGFPNTGTLMFNHGRSNQEQPVKYIAVLNNKTLLIDPGHTFANTHNLNSSINLISDTQVTPYAPKLNGDDLAIYLTSPANARGVVQEILASLVAAGITVKFVILLPDYTYLIHNPFNI